MAGFATIAALDEHSFVYGCLHPTASSTSGERRQRTGGAVPEKFVKSARRPARPSPQPKKWSRQG